MPAPTVATYSLAALVAGQTAFKTLIDAGGAAGSIKIRSAADVLLAQVPLAYPCGTVNGATGQLVFAMAGRDESANADGLAAYGEVCDSNGLVHLALPAQQGAAAVQGVMVINLLSLLAGGPVEVISASAG